jgi:shikimate kinase
MQAVFLYGPPGVGKLSVGRALAAVTGYKLFHNHLTIDLVSAIFERGTERWSHLVYHLWRDVLTAAMSERVDLIITDVFAHTPTMVAYWMSMLDLVRSEGATVVLVQLTCSRDVLLQRVQSAERAQYGKLTDAAILATMLERYDYFAMLPCEPHLRCDTTLVPPEAVAAQIASHYALPH